MTRSFYPSVTSRPARGATQRVQSDLSPRFLRELAAIVGSEHVKTGPGQVAPYSRDATPLVRRMPDEVVLPSTTSQVAAILRLASEQGCPVVPRGAGSNLCAGTVPLNGGIVLALTRMNRILDVRTGVFLAGSR